ncbi:salicylate esterase [Chitinispirillum alkaliphilum]|nr:salicylate esterase [Chitinispirillum alkaliphilum]
MSVFVIVHGGWGGGWEWTPVAKELRKRGHEVFSPTLTGMGERSHLGEDVGLSDHIDDLLAVLHFEELQDVILCGHSYSGLVITGVADRVPDKIKLLVYIDALVPQDGQALVDLIPKEFSDMLLQSAFERNDKKIPYPPAVMPSRGSIPDEIRESYINRTTSQPVKTNTEHLRLSGEVYKVRHAFIHCTGAQIDFLEPFAYRARTQGWLYLEMATEHDPHLSDPAHTADVLDSLEKETAD